MKIKLPLIMEDCILENQELGLSEEELKTIIEDIEVNLNESSILSTLKMLHDFYIEGQRDLKSVYPKMIEIGAITEAQIAELKDNSPNITKFDLGDFTKYLEPPYILMLSEENPKEKGTFGLTIECSWDPEHGLGVWFNNWKPIEVGFAEIAYK